MVSCDILNFKCIIVNELIGGTLLTVLFAVLFYFIIASKLRWGFETTIAFSFPFLLIAGLMFTGFSGIFAFATVLVGMMMAWLMNKIFEGR